MQEFIQLTINGLLQGGIYSLISIGLTLIFGVTRIVNFAHGEFLMLAMYATFFLFQMAGIDPYLSLLVVTPLLFLLGIVSERLVIHPILNAPSFMQIFATVGLSLDSQGFGCALIFPERLEGVSEWGFLDQMGDGARNPEIYFYPTDVQD